MKVLDLFSGIGGFSLGLERAGMETVAFCEIEKFPQKVLKKHWPDVPIYEDVRELTYDRLKSDGISRVDVICGGFPCQDISVAGKQAGIGEGTRSGLWSECARLVGEIRPKYAIFENVTALLSGEQGRWFQRVLFDLSALGYDAEWHCIPASSLGAPHSRDRLWIVAYSNSEGLEGLRVAERVSEEVAITHNKASSNAKEITRIHSLFESGVCSFTDEVANGLEWAGQQWPKTEPLLCRVDDGIPDRVGRTGACGNAVVPQIPELIGRAIMDFEDA